MLAEALPTLAHALRDSLARHGEPDLAAQVDEARVHATCACTEQGCLSVYLAPERAAPCGDAYRVVTPDAVVTIGVCRGRMEYVEDNELISPAGGDPGRRREYAALEGRVPSRLP